MASQGVLLRHRVELGHCSAPGATPRGRSASSLAGPIARRDTRCDRAGGGASPAYWPAPPRADSRRGASRASAVSPAWPGGSRGLQRVPALPIEQIRPHSRGPDDTVDPLTVDPAPPQLDAPARVRVALHDATQLLSARIVPRSHPASSTTRIVPSWIASLPCSARRSATCEASASTVSPVMVKISPSAVRMSAERIMSSLLVLRGRCLVPHNSIYGGISRQSSGGVDLSRWMRVTSHPSRSRRP